MQFSSSFLFAQLHIRVNGRILVGMFKLKQSLACSVKPFLLPIFIPHNLKNRVFPRCTKEHEFRCVKQTLTTPLLFYTIKCAHHWICIFFWWCRMTKSGPKKVQKSQKNRGCMLKFQMVFFYNWNANLQIEYMWGIFTQGFGPEFFLNVGPPGGFCRWVLRTLPRWGSSG